MTVDTYTADTNSMLYFIADVLPPAADGIYSDALAGEATIQIPPVAAAETAYILENRDEITESSRRKPRPSREARCSDAGRNGEPNRAGMKPTR